MNRKLFIGSFHENCLPYWTCPQCGSGSLNLVSETFIKKFANNLDTSDPDFEPEWVRYVFVSLLKCANGNCNAHVACSGIGGADQEYNDDGSGKWSWYDYFVPKHFEPPLQIFDVPSGTPVSVEEKLTESFSVFFRSPSTALVLLRSALETLLGELGVPAKHENGKRLRLFERIDALPDEHQELVSPVTAIRWLGNDGAHADSRARSTDALDGYEIFARVLSSLYPEIKASINELVEGINEARGPVK